jgi:outer membrane lipoprotein carrier protein
MACFIMAIVLAVSFAGQNISRTIQSFEQRYRHATTIEAIFFERYADGKGGVAADSGTVYFSRPGRMRWDYESPEQKLFLVDGTNVWFYVPADHTVSRAKLSESSDWRTPLALLAGKTDLAKLCRRIEPADPGSTEPGNSADVSAAAGTTTLRCIPRESPESETIHDVLLDIDPNGFLVRIVIRQAGGASTEFRFGNWQENVVIPESKFHFEPPPGVAVVDEQALAGTIR